MTGDRIKHSLKFLVEKLPFGLGRYLSYLPAWILFGSRYRYYKKQIRLVEEMSPLDQKKYAFERIELMVRYAYENIPFYRTFYDRNGFSPSDLRRFDDISQIPIVRKQDLQKYSLENRSNPQEGGFEINTGGSTGEPLQFRVESSAFAKEWAHMYHIWSRMGYSRKDLKLTFRGKNFGDSTLRYNAVNNEYLVNTYQNLEDVARDIMELVQTRTIKYLHGYPSAIYEFAKYLRENVPDLADQLKASLQGILYSSEYPAPVYRELVSEVFETPDISWYGHSEMSILAFENTQKWVFEPLFSYGFSEAVPDKNGDYHLIGTSYYNRASPFIRYDTEDIVEPQEEDGLLKSFRISKGRVGEYIRDKRGQNISLTSLIFGRHHSIFGKAKFIQIRQEEQGKAVLLITPAENQDLSPVEVESAFDDSNVDIDFTYRILKEPFKSSSGKIPLLVEK